MTLFSNRLTGFIWGAGLLLFFLAGVPAGWGEEPGEAARGCTIVIDPGHGGDDRGWVPDGGQPEKEITLRIAEQVATVLGDRYRVLLTRTGDYKVAQDGRAGAANRLEADLFISVHVSQSLPPRGLHAVVYHYDRPLQVRSALPSQMSEEEGGIRFEPWGKVQQKHRPASLQMAGVMGGVLREEGQGAGQVIIAGAPLVVLEGADMPALLVELFFHAENPGSEDAAAAALARGIEQCMLSFSCP